MPGSRLVILALVAINAVEAAAAGAFLEPEKIPDPLQLPALLDEFEAVLGSELRQSATSRIEHIAAELSGTVASLPKNQRGAVSAASARYAVHRYFVQRHGWQIKGLALNGESWSSNSPALAFGGGVPGEFRDLFAERVGTHGLDLHELAVLAATLEDMIHGEVVGSVTSAYRLFRKPVEKNLNQSEAKQVLDFYLANYYFGVNITSLLPEQEAGRSVRVFAPPQALQNFLRQVQDEVAPGLTSFALNDITRIVEAVSERYGQRFMETQTCEAIRSRLIQLEEANGTGRVKLVDFYESDNSQDAFSLTEHPEFLKSVGALDTSDPSVPRVIIPNYLNIQSNCRNPASAFYAICCMDMCEDLMDHLESEIRDPFARLEQILELVSALPSASVSAPRTLPAALVRQLEAVASHHNGLVPLHSRLFAQWMHFAYPRECKYPHISGTILNTSTEEWSATTGLSHTLSEADISSYVENLRPASKSPVASAAGSGSEDESENLCLTMWTPDEELIDADAWMMAHSERQAVEGRFSLRSLLRVTAMIAAAVSLLSILKGQTWFALESVKAMDCGGPLTSQGFFSDRKVLKYV